MRRKICVIIKNSRNPKAEEKLWGLSAREHLENSLNSLSFCKAKEGEWQAVLYDDMPLVTQKSLCEVADFGEKEGIMRLSLGKGVMFRAGAGKIPAFSLDKGRENLAFLSLEDEEKVALARRVLKDRQTKSLRNAGVVIPSPNLVAVDYTAKIEGGVFIAPFVEIKGKSLVKKGVEISSFTRIEDSEIGENTKIEGGVILSSIIGKDCKIGPFCVIRPKSIIGDRVRIGNFVEIKASVLGDGVKCAHLSYIGDGEVGNDTNVGCGVVFANYDGVKKHKTVVGEKVFLGCNVNLVAPLTVEDNSFIAAGTTVCHDVEENSFVIGRQKETVKKRKDKA